MYYSLYPEVAGGFGANVVYDASTQHVQHLHYEFDGWLGDDILQTSPCCYIVTDHLKDALVKVGGTGCDFVEVEISKSDLFLDLYPHRELPLFSWLQISGEAGVDDFGTSADKWLVVSENMLAVMREVGNLQYCDVKAFTSHVK